MLNMLKGKMDWPKVLLLAFAVAVVLFAYLNRAYAHIYGTIGGVALRPPARQEAYASAAVSGGIRPLRVDFVGDSLTAGVGCSDYAQSFPFLLSGLLGQSRPVEMRVHAVPGYKVSDANRDLVAPTLADRPDVVFVLLGANDVHGRTSLEDFRDGLDRLLSALEALPSVKAYVLTVPKIGTARLLYPPYDAYFSARTDRFNAVIVEEAAAHGAKLIPLGELADDWMAKTPQAYARDEFHPSPQGYSYWAQAIYAAYQW